MGRQPPRARRAALNVLGRLARTNRRCTTTKNSGMKNMPSSVPTTMPPSTPVPIARLRAGTRASGDRQRQHAEAERQRSHQDRSQAIAHGLHGGVDQLHAAFEVGLGELDDQDRVLAGQADRRAASPPGSRRRAPCPAACWRAPRRGCPAARPAARRSGSVQLSYSAARHRNTISERQRVQQRRLRAGLPLLVRHAGPLDAEARRQSATSRSISAMASPELTPGARLALDLHRGYAVVALEPRRPVFPVRSRERRERHHLALRHCAPTRD